MTAIIELTLTRQAASPWGLRLQGGVDFEKALSISSVTDGSPSHASGLQTGDVLLQINGLEAMLMTHKQCQDAIISAGNSVPLVVQRFGGPELPTPPGTWRPNVEIIGGPATDQTDPGQTYTKTSLVANPVPEDTHWDVKHNITAKGFQPGASSLPGPGPVSAPAVTGPAGFKSISAPVTKPISGPAPTGPPMPTVCWQCHKPITGVFLQIKGILYPILIQFATLCHHRATNPWRMFCVPDLPVLSEECGSFSDSREALLPSTRHGGPGPAAGSGTCFRTSRSSTGWTTNATGPCS